MRTPRNPIRRAWVVLEAEDGTRSIAEALPTELSVSTDAIIGNSMWHGEFTAGYRETIRLEGDLIRRASYSGPVPDAEPAAIDRPRTAIESA